MAQRAVQQASRAAGLGLVPAVAVIRSRQAANATMAQQAVDLMLAEQEIDAAADALLNTAEFTTATENLLAMLDQTGTTGFEFEQLVASLVQDAGRAAESVAVTTRRGVGYVRNLTPPSCSRCVVLAGQVYRYSTGFQRHPNDDCTMTPVREGDGSRIEDPLDLMRRGLVTGLSKADQRAIQDGADFNQVVNVRLRSAGMREAGRVLARRGRLTPEGIYATTSTREEAIEALTLAGYLL
jgi:hypothetical protein